MTKSYVSIGIACILLTSASLNATNTAHERLLLDAIDATNVEEVSRLLKQNSTVTHEYKRELLEAAQRKVDYYRSKMYQMSNKDDILISLAGVGVGSLGVSIALWGGSWLPQLVAKGSWWNDEVDLTQVHAQSTAHFSGAQLGVGGATALVGLYLWNKGYSAIKEARTAPYLSERARKVQRLIKGVVVVKEALV